MNWLRRTSLMSPISMMIAVFGVSTALAAAVPDIVESADEVGFYLDGGVSISENEASEIVSSARNNGSRFYLVVLDDTPVGGNTVLAESVYEDLRITAGTVLVLSAEEVGYFTNNEGFSVGEFDAAENAAIEGAGDDAEFASTFVSVLLNIPVATPLTAAPVTTAAASSSSTGSSSAATESSGGGGSGLFIFFLVIVGGGLLVFWLMRRSKKQTVNESAQRMAEARGVVQKQVDAIANDILDMEDEVRVANNTQIDEYYNEAAATYRTVTERLQKADSPHELVDLSNDLDLAIWQLDSAEALLDGKPTPPKPEPKRLEPERDPAGKVTIPAPRQDYQRRPGRRSSYGGSGLMEILIGVAGQVLAGGGGRRGGGLGGLGGMLGRRSSAPARQQQPTPKARGGTSGGVIPGPGSPMQRRSKPTSSRSRRTRRTGGGKIRGGGKRRRRR